MLLGARAFCDFGIARPGFPQRTIGFDLGVFMPKPSPKKPTVASLQDEFEPDAWERFESLVKAAAKMGPRPHDGSRPKPKVVAKKKTKKRA